MFDIFGKKKIKKQQEYIDHLEIKLIRMAKGLEEKEKAYEDLRKKYEKIKMELFLIRGEER